MLTIQNLRAYGANVDDGVQRCLNDEGFYLEMVAAVFKDGNLSALEQALENKDAKTAFEYAHALKGVDAKKFGIKIVAVHSIKEAFKEI